MASMEAEAEDLDCVGDGDLGEVKLEREERRFWSSLSKIIRQDLAGEMRKSF